MKIFVGNLPFTAGAEDVKNLFEGFGSVMSVDIVEDSDGDSRGFGFVEMSSADEAQAAIAALNEQDFMGRALNVSAARERGPVMGAPHGKGRRSRSFQRRQEQATREPGREERGSFGRGKPWEKRTDRGESKPWERERQEGAKPWGRGGRQGKPWEKRADRGESKPWERERQEGAKPRGRGGRQGKPWEKRADRGESKPLSRDRQESAKPWNRDRQEGAKPRHESVHGGKPWQNRPRPHKTGFKRRER